MAMAIPINLHLYRMVFEGPGLEDLSAGMIVGLPQHEPARPSVSNDSASTDLLNSSLEYINTKEPAKAKAVLARLLYAEPNSVAGWNNLCVAHMMDRELDQALDACNRALSIDPGYQLARNNLNWAKDEIRAASRPSAAR
jgi:Tfp pilus assembly protein PilF